MNDSGLPAGRPDGNGPPELGAADLLLGFHEAHRRVGANTARLQEASANVIALAELLIGKGVIGLEELDRGCCVAANGACGIGSWSVRRRGQRDRASSANATRTRSCTSRSTVIA
jgi:hypothetical protein